MALLVLPSLSLCLSLSVGYECVFVGCFVKLIWVGWKSARFSLKAVASVNDADCSFRLVSDTCLEIGYVSAPARYRTAHAISESPLSALLISTPQHGPILIGIFFSLLQLAPDKGLWCPCLRASTPRDWRFCIFIEDPYSRIKRTFFAPVAFFPLFELRIKDPRNINKSRNFFSLLPQALAGFLLNQTEKYKISSHIPVRVSCCDVI